MRFGIMATQIDMMISRDSSQSQLLADMADFDQTQLVRQIASHGFKIIEVPIIFTDRTEGQSKMSKGIFREAIFGVISMTIKSWGRKYQKVNKAGAEKS